MHTPYDAAHLENYSEERTIFEEGAYVLVEHRHNSLRRGPKSKLLPFLKGPMRVVSHDSMGTYILQDLISQGTKSYHMSNLRPFLYDERTLTPLQAVVTDSLEEFVVEKVVDFCGNSHNKRSDMSFKIRWAGYGESDDTWEPWDGVKSNVAVHRYLRDSDSDN